MPLRCIIVEDEVMFAEMLRGMLQSVRGMTVVSTVHSEQDGIDACMTYQPELLILDLGLPGGNGLQVAEGLVKCCPDSRIIILSAQAATFVAPAHLNSNIQAVIDKTRTYAVLQRELQALMKNMAPETTPADPLDVLSPREREVFRFLGRGLMTKEIAAELGIASGTVSLHRKRIAAKLNCRGSELLRFAALHASAHPAVAAVKQSA